MVESLAFSELLHLYVDRMAYSAGQLARLSGIPKPTILSWLDGRVKRPRAHDDLLKLAEALNLGVVEVNTLMAAAGHTGIAVGENGDGKQPLQLRSVQAFPSTQASLDAPFQAIPDLPTFVGREQVIHDIEKLFLSRQSPSICSIHGMGGIGKTTLAAHLAYSLRDHYPDGVLWGHASHSGPMTILRAFAQAYDVDVSDYHDVDSRSQIVRQLFADKKALIILDDVYNSTEVKYLLPPTTGTCSVLITTRRHDLIIASGLPRFDLDLMDEDHPGGLMLFKSILDESFVQENLVELTEIAELLGQLPLAVSIVANQLAYEPDWRVTDILELLRDRHGALSELVFDDQSVQLSFHVGYDGLSEEMKRFFVLLAIFDDHYFCPETAAYATEISIPTARRYLRRLYALSLVQIRSGKHLNEQYCYHLHPLMREFANQESALMQIDQTIYRRRASQRIALRQKQ